MLALLIPFYYLLGALCSSWLFFQLLVWGSCADHLDYPAGVLPFLLTMTVLYLTQHDMAGCAAFSPRIGKYVAQCVTFLLGVAGSLMLHCSSINVWQPKSKAWCEKTVMLVDGSPVKHWCWRWNRNDSGFVWSWRSDGELSLHTVVLEIHEETKI